MTDDSVHRTLERMEAGLRSAGLQGAVFLMPSGAVIAFAVTTMARHGERRNIGDEPLRKELRNALGDGDADLKSWFGKLQAASSVPKPAAIWHRPHLVVGEGMAAERLVTVFENPERTAASELAEIAEQIGIQSRDDLERRFRRATGRRLAKTAARYLEQVIDPGVNAPARPNGDIRAREAPGARTPTR